MPPPKKKSAKYFFCNYYVKFGHFYGNNHVKFENFVNFSGKNHVKFRHFVNFSYIFFGQKLSCPLKLTELLRLCKKARKIYEKSQVKRALSDVADGMSVKKAGNKWEIPRTIMN